MRRVFIVVLALLCAGVLPRAAIAQVAPSQIEVRVTDGGGAPLADARIFVSGPAAVTSALTPQDGTIRFDDVDAGLYELRVEHPGFDGVTIGDVEALPGRRRVISVTLRRTQPKAAAAAKDETSGDLKVIGHVQARSSANVTSVDVDEGSPLMRVSENLTDALGKIAGVSVDQPSGTGTLSISLRNADPSRTLATAGGTPLLGGGAPQLQQVAADLSSGVSVDPNGGPGMLGGAVNFRTLEPTKTWQGQLTASYGTYEHTMDGFSLSGGMKKLGIAVQHATRGGDAPLTGLVFADSSGSTYAHDGGSLRDGDFLKLRYSASPRLTLNGSVIGGSSMSSSVCTDDVTNVPCGFGPGNGTHAHSLSGQLGVQMQIGHVGVFAGSFANGYAYVNDDLHRVVAGVPEPYASDSHGQGAGFYASGSIAVKRHTISLGTSSYASTSIVDASGAFQQSNTSAYRFAYLSLADTLKLSERWSALAAAGSETSTTGTKAAAGIGLTLRPSKFESLNAQVNLGGNGGAFYNVGSFGAPASSTFNCVSDSVRVAGPNDAPLPGSTTDVELTYDRRGRRGTLHVNAYDRMERGAQLQAQFPLTALGDGVPAGYLDALQTIWDQAAICGGRAFDPNRIYVAESISGPQVRYRGFDASGQLPLGRDVIALPSYSVNGVALASADPRLLRFGSPYALNAQLPFKPLHHAGLLLDAKQPKAGLEYLLDGRWTSANNPAGLTSYVVASAGVTWQAQRGRFTALATNLFNADTGLFATTEFAQPLALQGGGTYLPVPTLLAPRSYTILYSVRAGRMK